jgi:nitrogen regulatory protein PII
MHFKLIVAMVDEDKTNGVMDAARAAGATGATVLNQARGEGLKPPTTFFGLSLEMRRDVLLLLVEEHLSRRILEAIARAGKFDDTPGTGIALQVDVEDAIGVSHQIPTLTKLVEDEL